MKGGKIWMVRVIWGLALGALMAGCGDSGGGGGSSEPRSAGSDLATITGTVLAVEGTAVDGDTNDPFSRWIPNDASDMAQRVPNPVTIAGFVCAAPTGVSGNRFESFADPLDVYRVALAAGQEVALQISGHAGPGATPDLDLVLYAAGNPAETDASRGTGASERLTIMASGDYDLVVEARSGASNYLLQLGTTGGAAAYLPEFVPGEMLVRFADEAPVGSAEAVRAYRAARTGLRVLGGGPGRYMRMALPRQRSAREAVLQHLGVTGLPPTSDDQAVGDLRRETQLAVEAMQAQPDVLAASLNYIRRPSVVPNDPLYSDQWHYELINLPEAWDLETGASSEVTVAVVDTGILPDHPDLADKLVPGYDFISDPEMSNDGDGTDADPTDPGDETEPGASSFHGTHVAGTVAAATDNGVGVAGVSWGAKIMPVRVLGIGGGTVDDILQGVLWAAGLPNDSGSVPQRPADIINLSLGGEGFSSVAELVYAEVRASGVTLIAAAGNDNSGERQYPAAYESVVSVSAVAPDKQRAPYSNFGPWIDVAAPGGDISRDGDGDGNVDGVLSTVGDDSGGTLEWEYAFYQGTSMASPHMAGVAALMKAANPGFVTPDNLDALLSAGVLTEDVTGNGAALPDNIYGYGLIDANRAVQAAQTGVIPKTLLVDPPSISLGPREEAGSFRVTESSGGGELSVGAVSSSVPWLQISASGLNEYAVSVDRTGLRDGAYGGAVTINYTLDLGVTSTVGSRQVSVAMQVGVPVIEYADAGQTWIVLVDPNSEQPVFAAAASNLGGENAYAVAGISAGTYYVVAGSDSDDDGVICDPGEACGGYPVLDQLEPVVVADGKTLELLDFVTGLSGERDTRVPAAGLSLASIPGYLDLRGGTPPPPEE